MKITRTKLEELTQEFIDRAMEITKRALEASPFKKEDLNEIILVGGQTRMPAMQNAVKAFFGKEPHMGVNPDEVVAIGAAIQGGIFTGDVKDVLLLDVIQYKGKRSIQCTTIFSKLILDFYNKSDTI